MSHGVNGCPLWDPGPTGDLVLYAGRIYSAMILSQKNGKPVLLTCEESRPLSVVHFLLWFFGSVAWLVLVRQELRPSETLKNLSVQFSSVLVLQAMLSGITFASLLVWIGRKWRGVAFPVQPGEWFLISTGLRLLITRVFLFFPWSYLWVSGLSLATTIGMYAIAMWFVKGSGWWRMFFASLLVQYGAIFLFRWLVIASGWSFAPPFWSDWLLRLVVFFPGVVLVIVALRDTERYLRGWLHWTGVTVYLVGYLLNQTNVEALS